MVSSRNKAGQTVGAAPVKYSVAELKKILKHMAESWWFSKDGYTVTHEEAVEKFIIFLKDKKRVEAILNGQK